MISGILFEIGIFCRHAVYRDDNLKPPERGLTGSIEHGTLSRRSYDHHCFDALVVEDFFQISLKKFIRRRFNDRFPFDWR